MSGAQALRALLEPLGVYRWEGSFQWAELRAMGAALDACGLALEEIQGEMQLMTAQKEGLEAVAELLAHRPATREPEALRAALIALLKIRDGSFSLRAINDNLAGCGLVARAEELGEPDQVRVVFPLVPGIPEDFSRVRRIIEDILPCHLEILYHFWYITWAQLEEKLGTWGTLESRGLSWKALEAYVG